MERGGARLVLLVFCSLMFISWDLCGARIFLSKSYNPYNETCGRPTISPAANPSLYEFIIGGVNAKQEAWPWMVQLVMRTQEPGMFDKCGGSILTKSWVLTAAHCIVKITNNKSVQVDPSTIDVVVGSKTGFPFQGDEPTWQIVKVEKMVPHPNYTRHPLLNDIALLQLKTPLKFDDIHILPICLPEEGEMIGPSSKECYAAGWGVLDLQGTNQKDAQLQQVRLPILPYWPQDKRCGTSDHVKKIDFCAGILNRNNPNTSVCILFGDSGGPLICPDARIPDRWVLQGVTSGVFEKSCSFARVSGFIEFIRKHIG